MEKKKSTFPNILVDKYCVFLQNFNSENQEQLLFCKEISSKEILPHQTLHPILPKNFLKSLNAINDETVCTIKQLIEMLIEYKNRKMESYYIEYIRKLRNRNSNRFRF